MFIPKNISNIDDLCQMQVDFKVLQNVLLLLLVAFTKHLHHTPCI